MAKGRKPQGYQDPLDSIFGMIFGKAQSKPVRTKPVKYSGYDGSRELTQALAEIASKPGNYVGDAAMTSVNESLNQINLVQFQLDTFDNDLRKGDNTNARARLRAGEIGKFLNNPNKFVESIFQGAEAERKFLKYMNMGRGMDSALLMAWAKKQGFTSKESFDLGMTSSNWLTIDQKNTAIRKFNDNSILKGLMGRGTGPGSDESKRIPNDLMKGVLRRLEETKGVDIIKNPGDMRRILSGVPGLAARPDFNEIVKEIYDHKDTTYKSWKGRDVEGSIGGRAGYIEQLQADYNLRAQILGKDSPDYDRLMKAHSALDMVLKFKGFDFGGTTPARAQYILGDTIKKISKDIKSYTDGGDIAKATELTKLKNRIESEYKKNFPSSGPFKSVLADTLLPWGNPISGNFTKFKNAFFAQIDYNIQDLKWKLDSATDEKKRFAYEFELASWVNKKKALQTLPGVEWRILLSDIDGARKAYQSTFLEGGLAASVIGGSFFNSDVTGFMAPGDNRSSQVFKFDSFKSSTLEKAISKLESKLKEAGKISDAKVRDALIKDLMGQKKEIDDVYKNLRAWNPKVILPRTNISKGYAALSYLYYLTPGSIGKSLFFNAEGFVALQQVRRMRFGKSMNESGSAKALFDIVSSDKEYGDFVEKFFELNMEGQFQRMDEIAFAANYHDFMAAVGGKKSELGDLMKELEKFYGKDQNGGLAQIIKIFGAPSVGLQRLNAYYEVQVKNKVNRYLVDKVFRVFVGDTIADKVLISGLGKLGLRQIIAATLTEVFAAIGSSVGPLGTFAGLVLGLLADTIANKIIKPFVQIFFAFLWSFMVVLIAGIVAVLLLFFPSYPLPQQHIPPTDALECANGNPFKDTYNFVPAANAGNLPNAPAGSTCPIQSPTMKCTQGDGPGVSDYHSDFHGVDIGQTGLADPVWYAPTDGRIVSFTADNYCLTGGNYGGAMIFLGAGIEYRLLHVTSLASGQVKKGTPVAMIQTNLTANACWTGPHFHLDVKVNGGYVDAEQWYKEELKCNIISTGTGCG